jgi:hypothetical protein
MVFWTVRMRRETTMINDHVVAHNPASVWQVPESFKSIYSHAVEVSGLKRLLIMAIGDAQ